MTEREMEEMSFVSNGRKYEMRYEFYEPNSIVTI
jgi:hypothetical protein